MEWKPIETAPKDETDILLFCRDDNAELTYMTVGYWETDESGGNGKWSGNYSYHPCVTHWMPLPEPPK